MQHVFIKDALDSESWLVWRLRLSCGYVNPYATSIEVECIGMYFVLRLDTLYLQFVLQ